MSTLKLLHAADLHLDSPFESMSPQAAENRREAQRRVLDALTDAAETLGADALLLAGDVFDSDSVTQETQKRFIRLCAALNVPVLVAPGNHDPYFPGCVWQRMELPANVHVFTGEVERLELPGTEAVFWGAAFNGEACGGRLEGFSANRGDKPNIMVLHGEVCSGESKYDPITRQQLEQSGMDYVALGHIHAPGGLQRAGGTYYANPGSPEGRGFDELGERGALLATVSEEGVRTDFVPLHGVRYELATLDVTGKDPLKMAILAVSGLSGNDHCRLAFKGETETALDLTAIRSAAEGSLAELQLRDETTLKRDLWALCGEDTLKGVFLSKLKTRLDSESTESGRSLIEKAAAYGVTAIENGRELL